MITGAVLGGSKRLGRGRRRQPPIRGAWEGKLFVLTHHPEVATPADGVTFLNCGPAEAVRIGLAAADGKNLDPIPLHRVGEGDPTLVINVRYRPATTTKNSTERVSGN